MPQSYASGFVSTTCAPYYVYIYIYYVYIHVKLKDPTCYLDADSLIAWGRIHQLLALFAVRYVSRFYDSGSSCFHQRDVLGLSPSLRFLYRQVAIPPRGQPKSGSMRAVGKVARLGCVENGLGARRGGGEPG